VAGEKSILIDSSRCCGCNSCYFSCKSWNSLPLSGGANKTDGDRSTVEDFRPQNWLVVRSSSDSESWSISPELCHHCSDAYCVKSCPVKAISYQSGWVVTDYDTCIGCGACTMACPYGAVKVHRADSRGFLQKGIAYKCDGCSVNYSSTPACVTNCPTGALQYDYRMKLIQKALKRVADLKKRYPEAHLTGLTEHRGENVLKIHTVSSNKQKISFDNSLIRTVNGLFSTVSIFTRTGSAAYGFSGKLYRLLHFVVTGKKIS
jgi:formate dehydrogenase iron-sulfur subunit